MSSTKSANFETRQSELKLGRTSLQVETLFRSSGAQSRLERPAGLQFASTLVAQVEAPASEYLEVSEASIAVPSLQLISGLSIEEIDAAVQENPDLLQDIEMTFTSTVDEQGAVVRYECRYGVLRPSTDSSFLLRIDDPQVHAAVFGSTEDQYVDWSQFAKGGEVLMSGEVKLDYASADELDTRTTTMSFLDDTGTVLGSMPIRFLAYP